MIYGKVWGSTEPLIVTPMIEVHRINAKKGKQSSIHMHQFKWNAFYCISGQTEIHVDKRPKTKFVENTKLGPGDFTTVKPGEYHRFRAIEDSVLLEIYYPEGISEDIIRRLEEQPQEQQNLQRLYSWDLN